jgi:hypothetical protein
MYTLTSTSPLTMSQMEAELNQIGFFIGGLSEDAVRYYYTILISQAEEVSYS